MLPKKHSSFFEESLKLLSSCPICKAQYNPVRANVIEEREDSHLIHIQCERCSSAVVATVVTSGSGGATSVGLVTDLTADDVLTFKDAEPVSADDVLEAHEALEEGTFLEEVHKL